MAIDKESSGLPEIDVSHTGTRVNLWMIIAIAVFLTIGGIVVFNYVR